MNTDEKLAYSLDDVARVASLGLTTVKAEVKAGRLASIQVGRRRLVTRQALVDFLAARQADARNAAHGPAERLRG